MNAVDDYISKFPNDIQDILSKIRGVILENVPNAEEAIAYGMPAYKLKKKPLIYFAAFKNHIGVYATPTIHEYFLNKLVSYKIGKGSVQFPLKRSIPYDLIEEMVVFKRKEINQL